MRGVKEVMVKCGLVEANERYERGWGHIYIEEVMG